MIGRLHRRREARAQAESDRICATLNARTMSRFDDQLAVWAMHYQAVDRIDAAVAEGREWAWIILPDAVGADALDMSERVLEHAHRHGFQLRPGGSHGSSASLIRLERSL